MTKYLLLPILAIGWTLPASAAVESGEVAPEFTLTDSKGTSHKLSDFRGKLVVLFQSLSKSCQALSFFSIQPNCSGSLMLGGAR